ncbi:MAG: diacylglycerol kinase family protein [Bdellovibrionota bacterium]
MQEPHVDTSLSKPILPSASYAQSIEQENNSTDLDKGFHSYIVVLNEKSGSADCPTLQGFIEERAKELNKTVHFIHLKKGMDLETELKDAAELVDAEVYVGAGGDGTLAAVAGSARLHNKVFAGIPCGTANVFAKEHNIPKDAKAAAELALTSTQVSPVDILDVEGRTFLCHISIGTYSWITVHTNHELKRKYGRIAYMFNAIKLMMKERIFRFDITIDGKKIQRKASTIMVTNAGSMGMTMMRWGENIATDDGIAEICIFKARTFGHYFTLLMSFIFRKPHKHLKEYHKVYDTATITGNKRLPVRADGEEIADGGFTFKIIKHGLRVILPETKH